MKQFLVRHPELAGAMLGLADAVPRAVAAFAYSPSAASLHGVLLLGNVHHVNGVRAFGLGSMAWFALSGGVLALGYLGLRAAGRALAGDNPAYLFARGLFGAMFGVLLLNVAESLATGKVTNYIGIALAGRFTAINLGDLLLWLCLLALLPAVTGAFALHVLGRARAGCG
jgi:hypothetical protein